MSLDFVTTQTDSDSIPDIDEITSTSDLTCEVCGKPLSYGGRGRKPKFCDEHKKSSSGTSGGSSGARSSRDVDAACAALSASYDALLLPLMMFSPTAAVTWKGEIPALNERNRLFLAADPALARRIVKAAAKGGATALLISHVMAFAPVAAVIYQERKAARAVPEQTDYVEF